MTVSWSENAWEDYLFWQSTDKAILKRINSLIRDIARDPCTGHGAPEPLKHRLSGYWSRRIDREHRLVYRVVEGTIYIVQCRYHY